MDRQTDKLDLFSLPVFLFEALILAGLGYAAYFLHFQYKAKPYLSGFYCDDVSLRHEYAEPKYIEQFSKPDNELVALALLIAVPITVIIFCELVNSMFGSLKFRKIRSICQCCKLHSITRRTVRFAGAYLLGFLLVMISCTIIATSTGHLRPYFAQYCKPAYDSCTTVNLVTSPPSSATNQPSIDEAASSALTSDNASSLSNNQDMASFARPPSSPILSESNSASSIANPLPAPARLTRHKRQTSMGEGALRLVERQWVMLPEEGDLKKICHFKGDEVQARRYEQLAMSWPSFASAVVSYACLFIACYLSFVGTARPVRALTCVLVMVLLLMTLSFDMYLVKVHYNHWEDVAAGSMLALVVVVFVLIVYLNKFRDSHYYKNQKLHKQSSFDSSDHESPNYNGYSNEIALEQYNIDKADEQMGNHSGSQQNGDTSGSGQANDLAMRYFQIPRANYRGAPRPLSNSTNHM